MKQIDGLLYQILYGKEIEEHANEVASFRIRYFRDFPYLYAGNLEYESTYLKGYSADANSLLIKVTDVHGVLLGVSTALPLTSPTHILEGASDMFKQIGHDPTEIFYYGEIILAYSMRGRGVARKIYELQDQFTKENGYRKVAIATVVREANDPRKLDGYMPTDPIWENFGFEKTSIGFSYHWPTIQKDGQVVDAQNPMVYWLKSLT